LRGLVSAAALVLVAMAIALAFRRLPHANLSLLFLLAVVLAAIRWGLWPSVFASLLAFLVLNFFFTAPLYTLSVKEEGDLATLVFFLLMAGITGNLAARMRLEVASNRAVLDRVSTLLDFSRRMAAATNAAQALDVLVLRLALTFKARVVGLLPDKSNQLVELAASGDRHGGAPLDRAELEAAWADGRAPRRIPGWTYLALATAAGRIGTIAVAATDIDHEQRLLAEGLCEQASTALARTLLVDSLKEAQLVSETEQLRSALLASVSHDLRTPLASIVGSATSVLEYSESLGADDRRALLQMVLDEAQRLDRYIQNLLDITRFGQRNFQPQREWADVNDLISSAGARLRSVLSGFDLRIDVADDVEIIFVHGALIEQALVNLLDNAAGFSPPGGTIRVNARSDGDATLIEVVDEGPGIEPAERERVFDMFYRARQADRVQRPGTGLGLAICRSIVAAHGGTIRALAAESGGTRMQIRLPRSANPTNGTNG
jgi:two-component system sensor histidine kinase KdpD